MNDQPVTQGWYLMSPRDVEIEVLRWRDRSKTDPSNAIALGQEEAMTFRDAGNIPDDLDRSLRLVLIANSTEELLAFSETRVRYEPDVHDAPRWRRAGSRPITVVTLRAEGVASAGVESWTDDVGMAALEAEWARSGTVRGIVVDAGIRSFVYKTVVELERAGRDVTVDSITDSLARWLRPEDVERVRAGLKVAG